VTSKTHASIGRRRTSLPLSPAIGDFALSAREVRGVLILAALLAAATVLLIAAPILRFAVRAPQLDVALTTAGAVVTTGAAALSFVRYREAGSPSGLLEASAFLVLAVANLVNLLAIVTGTDGLLGLRADEPGQLPLYFWALARLVSAALLATSAFPAAARRVVGAVHEPVVLWLPGLGLILACAGLWLARESVPTLIDPATLHRLADESFAAAPLPGPNLGILALDGTAGLLLVVAAWGYAFRRRAAAGMPALMMVIGLLIAAFSQLHFILYPAVYTGLVSSGDVLRVAFYLALIAGINAGSRRDLQALRQANARLRLLAVAEADRTAIAERARLARELHDGLAQDLWTAKLEFERLGGQIDPTDEAAAAQLGRVRVALDSARREATEAVGTLRSGFDAGLSLVDELPRRIDAFADRTGFRVDMDLDGRAGELPGVIATEALRIVDESLRNVEKHADATRIRVVVSAAADAVLVSVEDNGHGFSPSAVTAGHGVIGMQERAALIGGGLDIRSSPGGGTVVRLRIPVDIR
jgi:signal transduction histidine kinase